MRGLSEILKKIDSVAVVGASPVQGKIGNTLLRNIIESGFKGKVFPVNPKYEEIANMKCYRSLSDIPAPPDIVLVAVPKGEVLKALRDSAELGSKLAVVITSEIGGEHSAVRDIVERSGLRIIGPNSAGISLSRFDLHASIEVLPTKGSVGVIAQSGAVGGVMISQLSDLSSGVSFFFSLGNSADVTVEEALEYAAKDGSTESAVAYIEWLRDGRRFLDAARRLREAGKHLCVLKGGRGESSERAARSHTGGIATNYSLFQSAAKQAGAYLARDLDDLVEVCEVLRRIGKGKKAPIIVTNSGGVGVIAASILDEMGIPLKVPQDGGILPESLKERVKLGNPLDLGGDASIEDVLAVLSREELRREFDSAALIYVPTASEPPEKISQAIKSHQGSLSLPTIGLFAGVGSREIMRSASSVMPVVSSPSNLARAFQALMHQR